MNQENAVTTRTSDIDAVQVGVSPKRNRGVAMFVIASLLTFPGPTPALAGPPFAELVDPHKAPGNQFGASVVALSTGNVVVTSPFDDAGGTDAGAVYLFNGRTGALISTITGSQANDNVGIGGVQALTNGNYVVGSRNWDNGSVVDAGAVTWGSGRIGVSGVVSPANSLAGSTAQDRVGATYVVALGIGYFFIDYFLGVTPLANGNYVVTSWDWDNGSLTNAGASTWGNGQTGISGAVTSSNSLVGTTASGQSSGAAGPRAVLALTNGNYVVLSSNWSDGAATYLGAATFGNGASGVSGTVTAANSLVSTTSSGLVASSATALTNGNYVVVSPTWSGAATNVGAATWGDGATGISGQISASNSLVGSRQEDRVGSGGVTALTNGHYVVASPLWDSPSASDAGAATWGNGTTGATGVVTTAQSLHGLQSLDMVGYSGATALANGNYVVVSPFWANGSAIYARHGITGPWPTRVP